MAQIKGTDNSSILKIQAFLGLNENPDGDTTLKVGEMAEMRNFRITQDKHLQIRPGSKTILSLADALSSLGQGNTQDGAETRVYGVWRGIAGASEHILASFGGHIWDIDTKNSAAKDKGSAPMGEVSFFGFGGKVYLLGGGEYKSWDGGTDTAFATVEGYVPLIQTATTPKGEGTLVETVNRLTGKRRVQFSPDGTATVFQLPEKGINEVSSVKSGGEPVTNCTMDLENGTVTFTAAPAAGTNTVEIEYRKGDGARSEVTGMKYSELFNGATDTRVFLYGDGTNRAVYSGVPFATGRASAEYFPDLYELTVGESNTPLTALVRHYSRLMAFKTDSAWAILQGEIGLADGGSTAAFYVQPVNRQFGNEAPGQVRLLENNPLTMDAGSVYQWRSGSSYASYISNNENNAKRISDRAASTLKGFDLKKVLTANIKADHEFWFLHGTRALILNYANDSWYLYDGLPFSRIVEYEGTVIGFSDDGAVVEFSQKYRSDNGAPIDCYAATGAMDFDKDWLLKYSPMIFVAMQPASNARIKVTVETNRRSDYPEKTVAYSLATLLLEDFNDLSLAKNRKPQGKKVKKKWKKATFYRLIFKSNSASATATVIETDIRLRYAGNVK